MSTVLHSVNVTKREGVHRLHEVTLRRWEKKKNHHETSVHYWLVFNCTQIYRKVGAQTVKVTFKKQFLPLMAISVPIKV